ncbi:transmembrane, partial [Cystoisospora suis]
MKFAPWLDNMKRLDDARKKEKKHLEENRQKCKRLGIEQSEVERRALARIEEEDLILQDEPVQEERRKRSRIIMKYYKGLQDVKKALCCSKLWILLTSIYIDKQDFIDRGGRTSAEQQRHDDLVSQREKLYEKERQLKERLHALQKEKKDQEEQEEKDQEDEEHQRRGGGGGRLKRNV